VNVTYNIIISSIWVGFHRLLLHLIRNSVIYNEHIDEISIFLADNWLSREIVATNNYAFKMSSVHASTHESFLVYRYCPNDFHQERGKQSWEVKQLIHFNVKGMIYEDMMIYVVATWKRFKN
jgi:hypothetical protein